jgi:hypothetical protein
MTIGPDIPAIAADMVAHHLRLFGVGATIEAGSATRAHVTRSVELGATAPPAAGGERVTVLLQPSTQVLTALGVERVAKLEKPETIRFPKFAEQTWREARSLHPADIYRCVGSHEVEAIDSSGRPCWITVTFAGQRVLIVGTDLAGDLVRYRQGDPATVDDRPTAPLWGIPGERPTYLFEGQLQPGRRDARHADWWGMALAQTVAAWLRTRPVPLLPGGAPGAVVVTGDDDQAFLEKYDQQLALLDGTPLTYFLHPLTRHTRTTLAAMTARSRVEFGLHPDALDQPARYSEIFRKQADWFFELTRSAPRSVRNHGFLNDGYWGHLPVWLERGVRISANLPGVDGTILNGSLLPARVAWQSALTPHWSMLTAIGDGVRFALGADGPASASCITRLADDITRSKLPGVIMLNLHPQNVAETIEMHVAVRAVQDGGFVALTIADCIEWFAERDRTLQ